MKLVINKCFGGFSLSPEGIDAYLKRKGKEGFFYTQTAYKHREGYTEYTRVDKGYDSLFFHVYTADHGESFDPYEVDKDDTEYFSDRDIERHDPDLVAVVEELGAKADGSCASLRVVEIPDGVEYAIDEYDGQESATFVLDPVALG